jgi:hypothetical protein
MAALVLRIKFPPTYPLIYKTLRVDAKFTTKEAVKFIADTVNVTSLLQGSEGLYIPDEKRWLDDATPLTAYDSLQDVVREPKRTSKKNIIFFFLARFICFWCSCHANSIPGHQFVTVKRKLNHFNKFHPFGRRGPVKRRVRNRRGGWFRHFGVGPLWHISSRHAHAFSFNSRIYSKI